MTRKSRQNGIAVGPFAISKELITSLDDRTLRDLLARLLEGECDKHGIPASAIDVGGKQTAPDGGIDASVRYNKPECPSDWFQRSTAYFQCKAQTMRPADIQKEMCTGGGLRPMFAELAKRRGAYLIFSTDDVGTKGAEARMIAMRNQMVGLEGGDEIHLDFLSADRIARWANSFPSIVLWLLDRAGRPLRGWKGLSAWSTPGKANLPYLISENKRASVEGSETSISAAMASMRAVLAGPGGCLRLVGISGMGKTRLAEALFDQATGDGRALSPALAVYADAGLELATGPAVVTEHLASQGVRAILIVDNCSAKLHGQLAQIVRQERSRVSLLTIDYDVGDDQPQDTVVVRLADNSDALIGELLKQRCRNLTEGARERLKGFAGGNARIALAIGTRSEGKDDLANLTDSELIERLFQTGRSVENPEIRRCAGAAALVGAFHVESLGSSTLEHAVLAEQAGVSAETFYRHTSILLDWGVIQQRGSQRAVMPPALADKLAAIELQQCDPNDLVTKLISGPPRLFASFTKRVGRLHDQPQAVRIAEQLLARTDDFGALGKSNPWGQFNFSLLAPAAPESVLAAIEAVIPLEKLTGDRSDREETAKTLAHIAYDDALFERGVGAMIPLVVAERADKDSTSALDLFRDRFLLALSRTMATGGTRLAAIDTLRSNSTPEIRTLGLEALDRMLDHMHISSSFMPEWGARVRAKEFRPRGQDYLDWIDGAYVRLISTASGSGVDADKARSIIAHHFREHLGSGLADRALSAMQDVRPSGFWDKGWRQACEAIHFSRAGLSPETLEQLQALERQLRPKGLQQCFEAFVLGEPWRFWHPSGREKNPIREVRLLARAVGCCLGRSGVDLRPFLVLATAADGQNSTMAFGEGLAQSAANLDVLWKEALGTYGIGEVGKHDPGLLIGIIRAAERSNRPWAEERLDDLSSDVQLAPFLVHFHSGRDLGPDDVKRFHRALEAGTIAPERLGALMFGGATKTIPGADLAGILKAMSATETGYLPALETLHMRLFGDRQDKRSIDNTLIELANEFLIDVRTYSLDANRADHELTTLAAVVLEGEAGHDCARNICRGMLAAANARNRWRSGDFRSLCNLLMERYPLVALNEIVLRGDSGGGLDLAEMFFGGFVRNDIDGSRDQPKLDTELLMSWVAHDPGPRAKRLASLVPYCEPAGDDGQLAWTVIANRLIMISPDPVAVVDEFADRFYSGVSSGPFSLRFVRRKPLVEGLLMYPDDRVRVWARVMIDRLDQQIASWDMRERNEASQFE